MVKPMQLLRMAGTVIRAARRKTLDMQTRDSIGAHIARLAVSHAEQPALICEGETLTWRQLNTRANRAAHFLAAHGIARGDCVAMMMENRTEFLVTMLGVAKLGAVAGLLNTNQRSEVLVHSVSIIKTKLLIFGAECSSAIAESYTTLLPNIALGAAGFICAPDVTAAETPSGAQTFSSADFSSATFSPATFSSATSSLAEHNPSETDAVQLGDAAFYIFTSGTTGLPKAAIFGHHRFMTAQYAFGRICLNVRENERVWRGMRTRWLSGIATEVLCIAVLCRYPRASMHDICLHRRTLPLPPQSTVERG